MDFAFFFSIPVGTSEGLGWLWLVFFLSDDHREFGDEHGIA